MTETRTRIDATAALDAQVGQPYTFVTFEGETREGVTEVHPVDGRVIVRFPDGGWAYAQVEYV